MFKDGIEVRREDVQHWTIESVNPFTKATTLVNETKELGVTFYKGFDKGTIFRNE